MSCVILLTSFYYLILLTRWHFRSIKSVNFIYPGQCSAISEFKFFSQHLFSNYLISFIWPIFRFFWQYIKYFSNFDIMESCKQQCFYFNFSYLRLKLNIWSHLRHTDVWTPWLVDEFKLNWRKHHWNVTPSELPNLKCDLQTCIAAHGKQITHTHKHTSTNA